MAEVGKDWGHNLAHAHMPGIQSLGIRRKNKKIVGQSPTIYMKGLHEERKKGEGEERRREEGK